MKGQNAKCIFQVSRMVIETRKSSTKRAEAQAKAQASDDTEDAKKKIPVHQAKIKRINAKNKMKAALAQIKDAIEEFSTTEDSTYKEAAANSITLSWKRLVSGEGELITASEKLAELLGEADPTIVESDVLATIESNEKEKDKLLDDWKAIRKQNQEYMKAAKEIADHSSVDTEIQSTRTPFVQRKFAPDQSLKPKLLNDSANLLEVKEFIKEFKNYIQSGYNMGEVIPAGHYMQMRNILEQSWIERLDRKDAVKKDLNGLCNLLHEEAERKYPKHQRRINLMKMKKHHNESSTEFLRRI